MTLLLDKLEIERMNSGHLCLNLSDNISWDEFPSYASKLVKVCGGIINSKNDTAEIRIWGVDITDTHLRLVYEDYPQMVSLESDSDASDETIRRLYKMLSKM